MNQYDLKRSHAPKRNVESVRVVCANTITAPVETPLRWDVHEALFEKAVASLRRERREATKARCQAEDRIDSIADRAELNRREAVALAKASIGQHLEQLISLREIAHVDAVECILSLTKI